MSPRLFMTTDAVGGVWQYSTTLAAELVRGGMTVRLGVVGPSPNPEQRQDVADLPGLDLCVVDAPLDWVADGPSLGAGGRAIHDAARMWGADLLQLNQPAFAGRDYAMPVVCVVHSCVETWWRATHGAPASAEWAWHRSAVAAGLRAAAVAVAPSRSFAAVVQRAYGLDRAPRAVLNGVIPVPAPPEPGCETVLAAGRVWDVGKNFAVLDAAAAGIRWPVGLAGDTVAPDRTGGPALRNLRRLGRLGRSAMADAFARAPIFVAPSLYEPFGIGVAEAASARTALVLADIPTFRELWDGAAVFFDPREPAAVSDAVNRLIDEPPLRDRLAGVARARAERYTLAETARGMRDAYGAAAMQGAAA